MLILYFVCIFAPTQLSSGRTNANKIAIDMPSNRWNKYCAVCQGIYYKFLYLFGNCVTNDGSTVFYHLNYKMA